MFLYTEAARVIQSANSKEGSLKTLVYSSTYRNLRQLFGVVSESIKYQAVLKEVLAMCGPALMQDELVDNNTELAVVLLYELLVGNKFGHAISIRKAMRKYEAEIKTAARTVAKNHNAYSLPHIFKNKKDEIKALPRYARVNLIKGSVEDATENLLAEGWNFVGKLNNEKFVEEAGALSESQFGLDPLLKDVLVFPVKTDLHDHPLVESGLLVLQDRASCVPAHVLDPPAGSTVLDCCAAPGNKASHLASLMKDQGQVIALDRDAKRMATMKSLVQRYGAASVDPIVQDFLTLSPDCEEAANVEMILVDPSCSGSGMVGRGVTSTEGGVGSQRLQTLRRFQISLLKHALRFPSARLIVYSTCSVYQEENEEVVEEVMSNVNKYFHFLPVFPEWPDSRGLPAFANSQNFLRLSPEKHLTNGFFVACFERNEKPPESSTTKDGAKTQEVTMNDGGDSERDEPKKKKKSKKRNELDGKQDGEILHREINIEEDEKDVDLLSEQTSADEKRKKKKKKKKRKESEDSFEENTENDYPSKNVEKKTEEN